MSRKRYSVERMVAAVSQVRKDNHMQKFRRPVEKALILL